MHALLLIIIISSMCTQKEPSSTKYSFFHHNNKSKVSRAKVLKIIALDAMTFSKKLLTR